jgi:hypothetical protein
VVRLDVEEVDDPAHEALGVLEVGAVAGVGKQADGKPVTESNPSLRAHRANARRSARQRLLDVRADGNARIRTFCSLACRSARQLLPGAAPVAALR